MKIILNSALEVKSFSMYSFVTLFGLFLGSCYNESEILTPVKKSTFIYMVADNNLDHYAVDNIKKIEKSYPIECKNDIYVYIDRGGSAKTNHPILLRISSDSINKNITSPILKSYKEQDSCNPFVLKFVLEDVLSIFKENNSVLKNIILWSHGTGWLPGDNKKTNSSRSFGLDNTDENGNYISNEMDIINLKNVVFHNRHFDLLVMDACFMGGIEFAFEMKDNFEYLILSPSEILATGFPYEDITTELISDNTSSISIAAKFHEYYNKQKNALRSGTISVIKTSVLDKFSSLMYSVYQNYKNNTSDFFQITQYDKSLSNYYFDLKSFSCKYMNKEMEAEFHEIWSNMVMYYEHTPYMYSTHSLNNTNGLSIYIPNNYEKRIDLHNYYRELSWAKKSGANILLN